MIRGRSKLETVDKPCITSSEKTAVTRKDEVRCESIREAVEQDVLDRAVKKRQLCWFGDVQQVEDSSRAEVHCVLILNLKFHRRMSIRTMTTMTYWLNRHRTRGRLSL